MHAQYYMQGTDNNHVGPVTAELIARGVLAGHILQGTFVAPIGASNWTPLEAVPEVAAAIEDAREQAARSMPPAAPSIPPHAEATVAIQALTLDAKPKPPPDRTVIPFMVFAGFAFVAIAEVLVKVLFLG